MIECVSAVIVGASSLTWTGSVSTGPEPGNVHGKSCVKIMRPSNVPLSSFVASTWLDEFMNVTRLLWSGNTVSDSLAPRTRTVTCAGAVPEARPGSGTLSVRDASGGLVSVGDQNHGSMPPSGLHASSVSACATAPQSAGGVRVNVAPEARVVMRERVPDSTDR